MTKKVPYLPEEAIERDASALLAEYAQACGVAIAPPVPIEDIVEKHLKLGIEFDDTHRLFDVPRGGPGADPGRAWRTSRSGRRPVKPRFGSSMKPSHAANDNLNVRARKVWQPRSGRDLTDEDVRQIAENVTGFFSILADWSRAEMPKPANDAGKPVVADNAGGAP